VSSASGATDAAARAARMRGPQIASAFGSDSGSASQITTERSSPG
jgi:hypothetical protein